MIGFKDHPKPCGEFFVYFFRLYPGEGQVISAAVVWDLKNNCAPTGLGFTSPCDATDEAFVAWYGARTRVDSLSNPAFDNGSWHERYSGSITPTIPYPLDSWVHTRVEPSFYPETLPVPRQALAYTEAEPVYHHAAACALTSLLAEDANHDAYVDTREGYEGYFGKVVESITTHFSINAYSIPYSSGIWDMLHSVLYARLVGSPADKVFQRVAVEELYNTNPVTGTHQKWRETYYCTTGLLGIFNGMSHLLYTLIHGEGAETWGGYEFEKYDWAPVGEQLNSAQFMTRLLNTDKSIVFLTFVKFSPTRTSYNYVAAHYEGGIEIPYSETERVYEYGDREYWVNVCIKYSDNLAAEAIPIENNMELSAAMSAGYALAYSLAGADAKETIHDADDYFIVK